MHVKILFRKYGWAKVLSFATVAVSISILIVMYFVALHQCLSGNFDLTLGQKITISWTLSALIIGTAGLTSA